MIHGRREMLEFVMKSQPIQRFDGEGKPTKSLWELTNLDEIKPRIATASTANKPRGTVLGRRHQINT